MLPGNTHCEIQGQSPVKEALTDNVVQTVQILKTFGWILNFEKSVFELTHFLEYQGRILNTAQARVFLPKENCQTFLLFNSGDFQLFASV